MKCSICGNDITKQDIENKNYGYDTLEKRVFYRHNTCLSDVEFIFDQKEDESETAMVIITDEKINGGEIGE